MSIEEDIQVCAPVRWLSWIVTRHRGCLPSGNQTWLAQLGLSKRARFDHQHRQHGAFELPGYSQEILKILNGILRYVEFTNSITVMARY